MSKIGYARVSTDEQDTLSQLNALRAEGCVIIFEDTASGGSRDRPNLKRAIDRVRYDDTLVVVRIGRLARSLSHLLEIVETLRAKGANFRSTLDPIDTSSAAMRSQRKQFGYARSRAQPTAFGKPGERTGT
jgi:DNA invertase Pin-like site-specific DNA recombinase